MEDVDSSDVSDFLYKNIFLVKIISKERLKFADAKSSDPDYLSNLDVDGPDFFSFFTKFNAFALTLAELISKAEIEANETYNIPPSEFKRALAERREEILNRLERMNVEELLELEIPERASALIWFSIEFAKVVKERSPIAWMAL
jgi:hypothetical protein